MAKNKISEFSSTPANNTDIAGINIAEGCAPSGINNAIRELMAQLKDQQSGTDGDNFTVGGNLVVTGTATGVTPTFADSTTKFATTAFVQAALAALHPVGSIYTSTVATNPNTLFGFGTWVAFGAGRVMVGNGGGFSAGATGGSADAIVVSHTHSITDAGHKHQQYVVPSFSGGGYGANFAVDGPFTWPNGQSTLLSNNMQNATTGISINSTGSSGTNANLQPYIVVYMWNRTA